VEKKKTKKHPVLGVGGGGEKKVPQKKMVGNKKTECAIKIHRKGGGGRVNQGGGG